MRLSNELIYVDKKLVTPPFAVELLSFIVLATTSAIFVYYGLEEGIIISFMFAIQFQRIIFKFTIDKSINNQFIVESNQVINNELIQDTLYIYASNKSQAKKYFWKYAENNNIDVIGEISINHIE